MNTTMQTIIASGSAKGTPMQRAIFGYLPNATNFYLDTIAIEGKGQYIYTLNGSKVVVDLEDDFSGSIWVPAADAGSKLIVRGEAITEISQEEQQILTSLEVSGLTSLTTLNCNYNSLTSLDVSGLTSLTYLSCYHNSLTSLDVSGLTSLTTLNCNNNSLTSLDVSALGLLSTLSCNYNPLITAIRFRASRQDPSNSVASLITAADSSTGTVYLRSSDPYYSTVANAATAKGWTILPL